MTQISSTNNRKEIVVRLHDSDLARMQVLARITEVNPDRFAVFISRALGLYCHLLEQVLFHERHLFLGIIETDGKAVPEKEFYVPGTKAKAQPIETSSTQHSTDKTEISLRLKEDVLRQMQLLAKEIGLSKQFGVFIGHALNLYRYLLEQVIHSNQHLFLGTLDAHDRAIAEEELFVPGTEHYLSKEITSCMVAR